MDIRQHRVTIFLNDEEYNRLYNAVAEEKRPVSKILRKALIEYLDKLEEKKGKRSKEVVTAV
jgi:Ribbon-helix-helix protein, copG family.